MHRSANRALTVYTPSRFTRQRRVNEVLAPGGVDIPNDEDLAKNPATLYIYISVFFFLINSLAIFENAR